MVLMVRSRVSGVSNHESRLNYVFFVMPGLVPGIHVFTVGEKQRRGWPEQVRP
jgi:hypothetical protein